MRPARGHLSSGAFQKVAADRARAAPTSPKPRAFPSASPPASPRLREWGRARRTPAPPAGGGEPAAASGAAPFPAGPRPVPARRRSPHVGAGKGAAADPPPAAGGGGARQRAARAWGVGERGGEPRGAQWRGQGQGDPEGGEGVGGPERGRGGPRSLFSVPWGLPGG